MRIRNTARFGSVIVLTVASLSGLLFALGQGGTGRETSNANARKPGASKGAPSRKPSTSKQSAPAYKKETKPKLPNNANTNSSPAETATAKPRPNTGSIVRNEIGMELVYVPPGTFMMGSNNGTDEEKPVHQVTFTEGFYMGRYEVTQAEWKKVMGNNPSNFKGDRVLRGGSWNDASTLLRSSSRRRRRPTDGRSATYGFRVVAIPPFVLGVADFHSSVTEESAVADR